MAGKCLPIFVKLDFRVGLRIIKIGATDMLVLLFFATMIANIGGPVYLRRSHKIGIGAFETKLLLCRGDFKISGNGFICIKVWGFALLILSIP